MFGFIERSMGGLVFRGVGMVRAQACVKFVWICPLKALILQPKRPAFE